MSKRSLIETYSTLGLIGLDHNGLPSIKQWESLPQLRHSMERRTRSQPEVGQDYWDLFFLREALQEPPNRNSLSSAHIMARLELTCLFVVRKIYQNFVYFKMSSEECFYLARAETANPRKLFKNLDFHRGYKITTYAQHPLRTILLEKVRIGHSLIKYRPPGLLKNVSITYLKQIFKVNGIQNDFIYVLAKKCFEEICFSGLQGNKVSQIPWPLEKNQLDAIAQRYNSRCEEYPPLAGEQIQQVLSELEQFIRNSFKISHVSMHNNVAGYPNLNYEQLLPDNNSYEQKQIIDEDRKIIASIFADAFGKRSQPTQNMMVLVHGLEFRQGEIPALFGFHDQSAVSKELKKQRQELLKTLVAELIQHLKIDETFELKSHKLCQIEKELKECLKQHSQKLYFPTLKKIIQTIPIIDANLLRCIYVKQLTTELAASELNLTPDAVQQRHNKLKDFLVERLQAEIEKKMNISLVDVNLTKPSLKKGLTVDELIKRRLINFVETCFNENPTCFLRRVRHCQPRPPTAGPNDLHS